MIPFSRRARWLANLFTPSVTPTTKFPDRYSNDVSLVQPYDAGGWLLESPDNFVRQVTGVVGVSGTVPIVTVPDDSVYRLVTAAVIGLAGVMPNTFLEVLTNVNSMAISGVIVANTSTWVRIPTPVMVFPPGLVIRGSWDTGDAATQVVFSLYGTTVPQGVTFVL